MKPYELPPVLAGSTQTQIQQLRDYLTRLVMEMNRREQSSK